MELRLLGAVWPLPKGRKVLAVGAGSHERPCLCLRLSLTTRSLVMPLPRFPCLQNETNQSPLPPPPAWSRDFRGTSAGRRCWTVSFVFKCLIHPVCVDGCVGSTHIGGISA